MAAAAQLEPQSFDADLASPSLERYRACMILALVGDAVGYRGGRWEFRLATQAIHDELFAMTGGKGMAGLKIHMVRCHFLPIARSYHSLFY